MKVCSKCHEIYLDDKIDSCKKCKENSTLLTVCKSDIDEKQASKLSEFYHQDDVKEYDKIQNGLCFSVLGSISIIVGLLFIVLSLQRRVNKIVGINFASLQFVICVVCLVLGVSLLVYGLIKIILAKIKRSKYKIVIKELASLKTK